MSSVYTSFATKLEAFAVTLTGKFALNIGAQPEDQLKDKEQWTKFQNLPNLIYTDGNEWALYRSGERSGSIRRLSGSVTNDGAAAISSGDAGPLLEMLREFLGWQPVTPNNPKALAELLAPLCRLLRTEVLAALNHESPNISALATDWRTYFFPDADDQQFADAYLKPSRMRCCLPVFPALATSQ